MAPVLFLRFRDLVVPTPGFTIEEHQKLIAQHTYTWWGWWKKQSEQVPVVLWSELRKATENAEIDAYLVDSGQRKLYRAKLADVRFDGGRTACDTPEDGARTPEYYGRLPGKFASWFKFTSIEEVNPDVLKHLAFAEVPHDDLVRANPDLLGKRISKLETLLSFGNVTYWVGGPAAPGAVDAGPIHTRVPPALAPEEVIVAHSNRILHISDLHAGSHYAFAKNEQQDLKTLPNALSLALEDRDPGLVIVTGDLTWSGSEEEFEEAYATLDAIRSQLGLTAQHFVIIPGNHDIGWIRKDQGATWDGTYRLANADAIASYKRFLEKWYRFAPNDYLSIGRRFFLYNGPTLDVVGLNSSSLQAIEGEFAGLGRIQENALADAITRMGWKDRAAAWRILAVHHHVLPVVAKERPEDARRGFGVALDAGAQLRHARVNGVDMILHGHQHHPYAGFHSSVELDSVDARAGAGVAVVGGGSVSVRDEHLGPIRQRTFNLLELTHDQATLELWATANPPDEFKLRSQAVWRRGESWRRT